MLLVQPPQARVEPTLFVQPPQAIWKLTLLLQPPHAKVVLMLFVPPPQARVDGAFVGADCRATIVASAIKETEAIIIFFIVRTAFTGSARMSMGDLSTKTYSRRQLVSHSVNFKATPTNSGEPVETIHIFFPWRLGG